MPFKDHFSGHAALYRQARPMPPADWFAWLAGQAPATTLAWDAGCGSGQASVALAGHFRQVVATDPSARQLAQAQAHPRIAYRVEPAEHCSLPAASVDLVCVSQALHWFELDAFYREARRVARPGALIAVSAYANCSVDRAVDAVVQVLYADTFGADWPPERALIDTGYAGVPFPFEPVPAPTFAMRAEWPLEAFLAYLRTWSASQRHLARTGTDAVAAATPALSAAWGAPATVRAVRWPFITRVGRLD